MHSGSTSMLHVLNCLHLLIPPSYYWWPTRGLNWSRESFSIKPLTQHPESRMFHLLSTNIILHSCHNWVHHTLYVSKILQVQIPKDLHLHCCVKWLHMEMKIFEWHACHSIPWPAYKNKHTLHQTLLLGQSGLHVRGIHAWYISLWVYLEYLIHTTTCLENESLIASTL